MEEFYLKLSCWTDYNNKKQKELNDIRDEANMVVELNNRKETFDP